MTAAPDAIDVPEELGLQYRPVYRDRCEMDSAENSRHLEAKDAALWFLKNNKVWTQLDAGLT